VVGPEDKKDNFFQKAWETIVGAAGTVLENHKKDQIATKVPVEGSFAGSNTNIVEAVWELLKNAFIQALMPSVDNQINISSVGTDTGDHKTLLQKIFSGGKDKNKKEEKKDK